MCHHKPEVVSSRYGSSLEHGPAHAREHQQWSRRDFLSTMGLIAAGSSLMLGGTPLKAFGQTPLLRHLRNLETDRVLVLLQCSGGNDGLNTVIPVANDLYYQARPNLAIARASALSISPELGLHPSLSTLMPAYGDGRMAVLQNVGYPSPQLSHFDATDIWLSASGSNEIGTTGWLGRYLETEFPDFDANPTTYPLAVQMGGISSMLFQGGVTNMGMSLTSPELFERIAQEGMLYAMDGLPATTFGHEMAFVRSVANDAFTYAGAIQDASANSQNTVEYPAGNPLSENLAIIARLVKGKLGARIYHLSLGGFDTHADQLDQHANLLRFLAEGVQAFQADLAAEGWNDKVLVMTFSEFGRRVNQNGSQGTDHGTAAPLFLFGEGVQGGLYGYAPDLSNLDRTGNLQFDIDFRSVYATVLQHWFGLSADVVASVLGSAFKTIDFVKDPVSTATASEPVPASFTLHQNYPNPFNPTTTLSYHLDQAEKVTLEVFDLQGRHLQTVFDGYQAAGSHEFPFDASRLASGTYLYRLRAGRHQATRQMILVR